MRFKKMLPAFNPSKQLIDSGYGWKHLRRLVPALRRGIAKERAVSHKYRNRQVPLQSRIKCGNRKALNKVVCYDLLPAVSTGNHLFGKAEGWKHLFKTYSEAGKNSCLPDSLSLPTEVELGRQQKGTK